MFVGTMRSLVSQEEFNSIAKELENIAHEYGDIVVTNKENWVFPVDSFSDFDEDKCHDGFADLRTAVNLVAQRKVKKVEGEVEAFCEVTLPVPWVALELMLRSCEQEKLITLEKCSEMAHDCGIDDDEDLYSGGFVTSSSPHRKHSLLR